MKKEADQIIRSLVKVKLSISCWNGRQASVQLANELETLKEIQSGSLGVDVVYLPQSFTRPISTAASRLRSFWNNNSLPWEDGAWRIVSAKSYQKLMDGARELKSIFDVAVEDMMGSYSEMYEASRIKLGDLFDPSSFPSKDQLKSKYSVVMYRNCVNSSDEVRIDGLNEAAVADIKNSVTQHYSEQLTQAVSNIVKRLREVAEDIIVRMSKSTDGTKYSTLIKKMVETCDSLATLNVVDDPKITELINKMREMARTDGDNLRLNTHLRDGMRKDAKEIISVLDTFQV